MNLFLINKEFEKLEKIEENINYKFEPRFRFHKGKRHIHFNDLKNDFEEEINTYGFSPFIQDTYNNQKRDKNIMSYKTNYINKGLTNYVKKKNYGVIENEEMKRPLSKVKITRSYRRFNNRDSNSSIKEVGPLNNKDGNFLKKALDHLAKSKGNNSSQEFQFFEEEEQISTKNSRKPSLLNQNFRLDRIKSTFLESIGLRSHPARGTSDRNIKSAYIPMLNVEKYRINVNANRDKDIKRKKMIRLVDVSCIGKLENNFELDKNLVKNFTNPRKTTQKDIKIFERLNSLKLNMKSEIGSNLLKDFHRFPTKDEIDSKKMKRLDSSSRYERLKGTEGIHSTLESFKILATKIYSNDTLEKEKKFKDSEKKIFKSRNSLLMKFSNL